MLKRLKCTARRYNLPLLFVGQGLLKIVMFMAPATLAFFQSLGHPGWVAAFVISAELYLLVALAAGIAPPPSGPCGDPAA